MEVQLELVILLYILAVILAVVQLGGHAAFIVASHFISSKGLRGRGSTAGAARRRIEDHGREGGVADLGATVLEQCRNVVEVTREALLWIPGSQTLLAVDSEHPLAAVPPETTSVKEVRIGSTGAWLGGLSTVPEKKRKEPVMETTIDARTAYTQVARAAEVIRSDDHEVIATMSPGDVVRQGDIYITCLHGETSGAWPAGTRKLTPGETRGARHVAEGDCDVLQLRDEVALAALRRVVPGARMRQFFGPMIRARGPVTITHAEHGDRTLPGEACYLVTYQRAWRVEDRRRESIFRQLD